MQLRVIDLAVPDENFILQKRVSSIEEYVNAKLAQKLSPNIDETELGPNVVSVLNLQSLKRGKLAEALEPNEKLQNILFDIKRLNNWIQNYKSESAEAEDSVKVKTFFEAGMRLKMVLDHSDFDDGELRTKRRKAISEIDEILKGIRKVPNLQ